jgi:hypothetical protein
VQKAVLVVQSEASLFIMVAATLLYNPKRVDDCFACSLLLTIPVYGFPICVGNTAMPSVLEKRKNDRLSIAINKQENLKSFQEKLKKDRA